jgi:diaminopimelate decarboxylase
MVDRHWPSGTPSSLNIVGIHFHLDGYDPRERSTALAESMLVIDALRERGHRPTFIDFGGGIPMSYLDDGDEWNTFWREHRAALLGDRSALTFAGHGLGLTAHNGEIIGDANVYPYHQTVTRGTWLDRVLRTPQDGSNVATSVGRAAIERGLQLRCEPGRSLVDGCGLTAARVEFRKRHTDGKTLVGLAMNRTQCRSTSDDFLVDPLLLRPSSGSSGAESPQPDPATGYLVGAYCIERELLTWRELYFPRGVEVGDIVVFPNTAGYLMHILESASHQIPLARNLIVSTPARPSLDAIDADEGMRAG